MECVNLPALSDGSEDRTSDTEAIFKNGTKERDELKRKLTIFGEYKNETKYTCIFNGWFPFWTSTNKDL